MSLQAKPNRGAPPPKNGAEARGPRAPLGERLAAWRDQHFYGFFSSLGRLAARPWSTGLTVLARSTKLLIGTVSTDDDPNITDANGRFTTLSPPGDVEIDVMRFDPRDRSLCLPKVHRAIAGPTEVGDLVASAPPCH